MAWMRAQAARVAGWDRRAMAALPALRRRWITPFMTALSWSGMGPTWVILAVGLTWGRPWVEPWVERPGVVLAAALGAFLSLLVGQGLKRLFRRRRPFVQDPTLITLGWRPRDASLPSTHASSVVALATGLAVAGHGASPAVAVWAVLVCLSRYYLGFHFPSDLVAGAALGVVFGLVDHGPLVRLVLGVGGG